MQIQELNDREVWNLFLEQHGGTSFLQAWEWGEFNEKQGYTVYRLGVSYKNELVAIALTIKIVSRRGTFLFIPHGPVFKNPASAEDKQKILKTLNEYLAGLARREKCAFIRIAPAIELTDENLALFKKLWFHQAPLYMQSERMWELPLDTSEEELLAGMRKTTRYLIRRAPRDGVEVEKRTDEKAVDDFWNIYEKTVAREKFIPFSKKYIRDEFEVFKKTGNALFLFAKHENQYLATALIIFTKRAAFYHQGASIHTPFPAPYALQWEAIKEAKKRGCKTYSFWGVTIPGRTPNWGGVTLFKKGFGGQQVDYVRTQDFILSAQYYYFTYLLEKLIAVKRRL